MDDLLNEEDFLPKEYNPRQRFAAFCSIAALTESSGILFLRLTKTDGMASVIAMVVLVLVLPITLSVIMIFRKKEIRTLKTNTIVCGVAALFASCFTALCLTSLGLRGKSFFSRGSLISAAILLCIYLFIFVVTVGYIKHKIKTESDR